jgi:hypothetical protein
VMDNDEAGQRAVERITADFTREYVVCSPPKMLKDARESYAKGNRLDEFGFWVLA